MAIQQIRKFSYSESWNFNLTTVDCNMWAIYTTDGINSVIQDNYLTDNRYDFKVGDQVFLFSNVTGVYEFFYLGVRSASDSGVSFDYATLDKETSDTLTLYNDRIALLESNTGAPVQTYPGVLQLSASTYSQSEGSTISFSILRTNGSTGTVTCVLTFVPTGTGSSTFYHKGAAITTGATITLNNGETQADISVVNASLTTDVSYALEIASAGGGATLGTVATATLSQVNTPTPADEAIFIGPETFSTDLTGFDGATTGNPAIVSGECRWTLTAGTTNSAWLEKYFGTYVSVGNAAEPDVWIRGKARFEGASTMFSTTNTNKFVQVNFQSPNASNIRSHQVQPVIAYNSTSGQFDWKMEAMTFDSTGNFSTTDPIRAYRNNIPPQTWAGVGITLNETFYWKLRVSAGSAGAATGIVQMWINDVLIFNLTGLSLNDSNDYTPNKIILSSYQQGANATTSGYMFMDDVTAQDQIFTGTWAPTAPVATTYLVSLDPTAASPYGASEIVVANTTAGNPNRNTCSIVTDSTLNKSVLKIAMADDGTNGEDYAGFRIESSLNSWAASVDSVDEMCFRQLIKFGDSTTEPFFRIAEGSGSGIKMPSFGLNSSRLVALLSQTAANGTANGSAPDGTSDTYGRLRLQPYNAAGTPTNYNPTGGSFQAIKPGIWYWFAGRYTKSGTPDPNHVTDSVMDFWFVPYTGASNEYAVGSPTYTITGFYWNPADWNTANGKVEQCYRAWRFLNKSDAFVTRNIYMRYFDIGSSFIGPSAA